MEFYHKEIVEGAIMRIFKQKMIMTLLIITIGILGLSLFINYFIGNKSDSLTTIENHEGTLKILAPSINVTQSPSVPVFKDIVNITAHITNSFQIQTVDIETNHTGIIQNYTMDFLGGTLFDGIWNFTFTDYPLNKDIFYRVFATDIMNDTNSTDQYSFGVFDVSLPNIIEVNQTPSVPSFSDIVNVTTHVADNTEIQIISIETNYTGDLGYNYYGEYSFSDDIVGGDPLNWTVNEPGDTHVDVIAAKEGHRKVVELNRTTQNPSMTHLYSERSSSSGDQIEFWIWGDSNSQVTVEIGNHAFGDPYDFGTKSWIYFNFYDYEIVNYNFRGSGSDILTTNLMPNTWHHVRIQTVDSWMFQIWLNDVYLGQYDGWWAQPTFDRLRFRPYNRDATFYAYVDAIDYSWTSGYYQNRNKDYELFYNYTMTLLSGTKQDGYWNFTFDNYVLNKNITYRIFATDVANNTNSTGFQNFGVFDWNIPNIQEVIQDPSIPIYRESVNISTHITDGTQVQTVYLESNHTRNYYGKYSFTDDPIGGDPSDWTVNEPGGSTIEIVVEKDGHTKAVEFYKSTTQSPYIQNTFTQQGDNAEIEFWAWGDTNAQLGFSIRLGGNNAKIWFLMNFYTNELVNIYNVGSSSQVMSSELYPYQWHHIRIRTITFMFYQIWLNDVFVGQFEGFWAQTNFDTITFGPYTHNGPFKAYIDAVDYSWAKQYSLNRNQNYTLFSNYTMTHSGGSLADGVWNYTIDHFPINNSIFYRIFAIDAAGNTNSTAYQSFGVFDTTEPDIQEVNQDPASPTFQDLVNITAHIIDSSEIQVVFIETNYTSTLTNYTMTLLSGTLKDGIWNFSFITYPLNKNITYRIFARDVVRNINLTNVENFGVFDTTNPIIQNVSQDPAVPTFQDIVTISAHIIDNFQIQTVLIETNSTGIFTNYSMTLVSGTLQDGTWNYSFYDYPLNIDIWYRIFITDVVNQTIVSGFWNFSVYDNTEPVIEEVIQNPSSPNFQDDVTISARVTDNFQVNSVYLETNLTLAYWGEHNFTNDPVGSNPTNWSISEPGNSHVDVTFGKEGHFKVVELCRNGSNPSMTNIFPTKDSTMGYNIEFWVWGDSDSQFRFDVGNEDFNWGLKIWLQLNFSHRELRNWRWGGAGGPYSQLVTSNLTPNMWNHFHIKILDNFAYDIWLNGVSLGQFWGFIPNWDFDRIRFTAYNSDRNVYVDAIDYGWAPGYYLNRNTDYKKAVPSPVFSNIPMNLVSGSLQDGFWNFTLHDYPLNHNIWYQIIAVDLVNNMNYSGYQSFGVMDYIGPNITDLIQDPASPIYQGHVNVTVRLTEYTEVEGVLIEANYTKVFANYSMTLLGGSTRDGTWNFTFTTYPINYFIAYRIFATDILNNTNTTNYSYFGVFDYEVPNITKLLQDPIAPIYQDTVNVTVHLMEFTEIQGALIESNHTGIFVNYSMTLLGGSTQDGTWNFTFSTYPVNNFIAYRIFAIDIVNNTNLTNYFYFGVFDNDGPNIQPFQQVGQLIYQSFINVTVFITDYTEVQTVLIENNHTGSFSNYSMSLLSGTVQDGSWNFTIFNYTLNMFILYRIFTRDIMNNTNSTIYYLIYIDSSAPIITFIQDPLLPVYPKSITISAQITDKSQIQAVFLETNYNGTLSNYSMTIITGTLQDGTWNFTFPYYPQNTYVYNRIIALDILNNANSTVSWAFYVDTIAPNITTITQMPPFLNILEPINVTAHILDNWFISSAVIESNYTGSWTNQSMSFLSGTALDSFWRFTFNRYPVNKSIWYRIFAFDAVGNTTVSNFNNFGIFPLYSWETPSELELEISLDDRIGHITFQFKNTGKTIFLSLNFTINLPEGWICMNRSFIVPTLHPGENITINFYIVIPDSIGSYTETIIIDFQATLLETGQSIQGFIRITITGVKNLIFIWLIVIIGSAVGVSTFHVIYRKRKQKRKKPTQRMSPPKSPISTPTTQEDMVVSDEKTVHEEPKSSEKAPTLTYKIGKDILNKINQMELNLQALIEHPSLDSNLITELKKMNTILNKLKENLNKTLEHLERIGPHSSVELEKSADLLSISVSHKTFSFSSEISKNKFNENLLSLKVIITELVEILPPNTLIHSFSILIEKHILDLIKITQSSQ